MITVAALSPSLDLTYLLDSYALGRMHRTPGPIAVAGGKALNMARAARAVGAEVVVVVLLGGPTGQRVARIGRSEGLELVVVEADAETRTCVSVAAADTGELTEIYEDSPGVPPAVLDRLETVLAAELGRRPGWLSISGRGPVGSPDAVPDLVRLGAAAGAAVAVDSHGEALPGAVAARPALLKINRAEAAEVLGVPEDGDLAAMATALHARSGAAVVLTDSTAGAVTAGADGVWRVGASTRRGRYAVGSGDSFLGGLLAGLDGGRPLAEAVRLGTGCAVANALVPGQGHFDVEVARTVADEVTLSRLG
ncbi:tagatose 6-phosphate kinase [Friedmanniella luteola]|uniref:Tagatose 6-phosphate kinase n=1 Tax=Friedmanniella luteola TaxID=546871 RepID=A0A1H1N0E4_9ACTN|nr:PfkB family carbohydrate kinase [Friedmanniella luteola]SDR92601.1 tagatose 6-phosphate kinase [Friedmanniella luteola]